MDTEAVEVGESGSVARSLQLSGFFLNRFFISPNKTTSKKAVDFTYSMAMRRLWLNFLGCNFWRQVPMRVLEVQSKITFEIS